MGDFETLEIDGKRAIRVYHAKIREDDGHCRTGTGQRHFCSKCATALWMYDDAWPDLVHPFASAIDAALPRPPSKVHLMLGYKPSWVAPDIGPGDKQFREYPKQSIEDWHRKRGLWID
ncbi:MAG: hypothetical protein WDN01_10515 [Rhizomicrobium sp.]